MTVETKSNMPIILSKKAINLMEKMMNIANTEKKGHVESSRTI